MHFGGIIIQSKNLLLISSILISYVIFYYDIRILKIERTIVDLIVNSFINGLLIWKFSYIVLQNPMTILYFNGGYVGIGIGTIFIVIYTWLYLKKQNMWESI